MSDPHITPKLIRILTEVTKQIYPLVPSLRKYVFIVHGSKSYELQKLAVGSTEKLIGTFEKSDELKELKDFASVAALISPADYEKSFLYELREDKTFRFYLMDGESSPEEKHEVYPLDFPGSGDGVPPECGIYVASVTDGRQTFAAYIIKERFREKREILAVPPSYAGGDERAESYASRKVLGGRILSVFRYSMRDTYKNPKQTALLDKAMRMLEKSGLCESCEKNTEEKRK